MWKIELLCHIDTNIYIFLECFTHVASSLQPCKFIGTKQSVYMPRRKVFTSPGLVRDTTISEVSLFF